MIEKKSTKDRIIEESLKLFSISGFEAVSIREIADAVGIENSAIYKHFRSKQHIFDTIVEVSKEKYLRQSNDIVNTEIRGIEQVKNICLSMYRYQTQNKWIVMFRRLLIIEQFKNTEMSAIFKEFFIDIPLHRQQ